jgi:hypothetical protein
MNGISAVVSACSRVLSSRIEAQLMSFGVSCFIVLSCSSLRQASGHRDRTGDDLRPREMPCTGIYPVLHHGRVQPTVDSFQALARSSPWRWRTLHFTRRGDLGPVEAWLRRPGELVVRRPDGSEDYVTGVPYSTTRITVRSTPDGTVVEPWEGAEPDPEPRPTFRPDGLVAERPEDYFLEHGDPMWQNYTWTAMLDPDELSHDVAVDAVRADRIGGREVWRARLRPLDGYEPRCGCCALLWSEVSVRGEYGDEPDRLARLLAEGFPDAYDVALDTQTGVVVALEPVGRDPHDSAFTVEIHQVDADLDTVFTGCVVPS